MTVRSLHHVALTVPDAAVGKKFFADFGLDAREDGKRIVLSCRGRDQDQMVLVEGPKKRLHHVSFGASAKGMEALKQRLQQSGTKQVDSPKDAGGDGVWFHDPDGALLNVRVTEAAPWRGGPELKFNYPGHIYRPNAVGHPARNSEVRPRRLSHVLRFTPDIDRQIDFYTKIVGLKLSDRAQNIVAFLRSGEGPSDHHILAFLISDKPGYHHSSYEVANIDELGMGASRLLEKGYRDGWGFGRHVIGSNFFHYIRDPWMSLAEYSCDIDHIPDGADWKATNYPPEDSLYVWGPKPPEDFGRNFEANA